jgi:hypothetical protein
LFQFLPAQGFRGLADIIVHRATHRGELPLYAFKLHRGKLPLLIGKNRIVPITVEHVFANDRIDPAVKLAAKKTSELADPHYT